MKRPTPKTSKSKVLIILGPTASGKTSLAIKLAKKYGGEVISADSRQVYTGLNLGSGKVTKKEMSGVPHHLLDIVSPRKIYSVEQFKIDAEKAITEILSRGNLPIICGGTGFYIESLVKNIVRPDVKANPALRKKLSKLSTLKLSSTLKKLDLRRWKEIDKKNPARLIRAIEIAKALGKVPPSVSKPSPYTFLQIGITTPDEILRKQIHDRLLTRMKQGMLREVQNLRSGKNPLSWRRLYDLGLEYRYLSLHLRGKITKTAMLSELETAIWHFAKNQRTWFKRDETIVWHKKNELKKIEAAVKKFIS